MVGVVTYRDDLEFALVASTPRSGTTYIRAVLEGVGLRCGHENVYMSSGGVGRTPDWLTVEVSGFAGLHPFINDGPVLHQMRHPMKVISSLASLGIIRTTDPVEIAEWYVRVTDNNEAASDLTYRIEDMDVPLLRKILDLIGEPVDDDVLVDVLARIPRDTNSRPRAALSFDALGDFGPIVAEMVDEWGYEREVY